MTPGRYVGIEEQEDDGEPFEEKMTRLTSLKNLLKLFVKIVRLIGKNVVLHVLKCA